MLEEDHLSSPIICASCGISLAIKRIILSECLTYYSYIVFETERREMNWNFRHSVRVVALQLKTHDK